MAFNPRLPGNNLNAGGPMTDVQAFLHANSDLINDEPGRDVDFQLGFGSLRRTEMVRIALRYGVTLDPNQPGEAMMARMEQYFIDGAFPDPPDPVDEVADLKAQLEEMREMVAGLSGKKPGRPRKEEVSDGVHAATGDEQGS